MFDGSAGSIEVRFSIGIILSKTIHLPFKSRVRLGVEGTINPLTGRDKSHPYKPETRLP